MIDGGKVRYSLVVCLFLLYSLSFAVNYSAFDVDGKKMGTINCDEKTNCRSLAVNNFSKAVVLVRNGMTVSSEKLSSSIVSDEMIAVSTQNSSTWIEVEKNKVISLCIDGEKGGVWSISNLDYRLESDSCLQISSGNVVKTSNVKYNLKNGKNVSVDVFVGIKRIDLTKGSHELGFYGNRYILKERTIYMDSLKDLKNRIYPDSVRNSAMEILLAVDEYKVTNCEIVQTLWDSIPAYSKSQEKIVRNYHDYWIEKKKGAIKNGSCDAHDSAAIKVYLYDALIYANARSARDNLEPVYSFKKVNKKNYLPGLYSDGSFDVYTTSFLEKHENVDDGWIRVLVNKNANGYRLPYYDEWMSLAKAGQKGMKYVWGNSESKEVAAQYAWFGEGTVISEKYGVYQQESKPVGMKKPNGYGLYDMAGLVCENVMLPGKSIFANEITSCKGGFLYDSLQSLNFGAYQGNSNGGFGGYQGLRLVRTLK